ncbi:hypothetical protein BC939DRAFT_446208 [Gamsiella multidivaricata]|uniref:uncharacterized protein n=1 Tax=Gamsiella multidivaricata TaxID=101098 RepID=UPI002220CC2C|nr:uncharacterized protein BC939DRAFT_446208 [Gamsiella multidivaricata]KAG0350529.1 hypothetical protein BGZ54_003758 [Gamsiella multidivaricata]KAI7826921.1 hypothetical protein BC939DRAFT_446208 [Gamsiella multidivaricata]
MKFTLFAVAAAAFVASAEAACRLSVFDTQSYQGKCNSFDIPAYETCYSVSPFTNIKSIKYYHDDPAAATVTLTLFDNANCGGKYTRASIYVAQGSTYSYPLLENVSGNVRSIQLHKGATSSGNGETSQNLPSTAVKYSGKC